MNTLNHQLPNILIAGYHKAGTTSLFHELAKHPDIFPSLVKEPFYFRPYINGQDLPPIEEYARNFMGARDEKYRMEASPTYIYGQERVARKIQEVLGDVKVIISLRNPVDQLFSLYKHHLRFMKIEQGQSFLEFVQSRDDFERQTYVKHLSGWYRVFGNNLKIIFFEDLLKSPDIVMRNLTKWLKLQQITISPDTMINANPGGTYKYYYAHRMALGVFEKTKRYLPHHFFVCLRKLYYRLNGQQVRHILDDASRAYILKVLAQQNAELKELLISRGYQKLPAWLAELSSQDEI